MASADRMERERLAKRARILDAARELFVERGVQAVTLREIAQRIEYSTTAIYVQFKDKQDLVAQMVREDFGAFTAALGKTAAIADPIDRLDALGAAYVNFALTMPRHYQLLFMTPPEHDSPPTPDDDKPGIDGYRYLLHTVEEAMTAGRFRPELRDAAGIAQALWANVHGLASLLIVVGTESVFEWRSPEALLAISHGALLRGLLAAPKPRATVDKPRRKRAR